MSWRDHLASLGFACPETTDDEGWDMLAMRCKAISAQPHEWADSEYNWFVACCYAKSSSCGFYAKSTARHWQSRLISIAIGIGTKSGLKSCPCSTCNHGCAVCIVAFQPSGC